MQTGQVQQPISPETKAIGSLYDRLGGSTGIAAIVEEILALHRANPLIKARFEHYEAEKLTTMKLATCNLFGAGTGGPEIYEGSDLITTHKGMDISEQEFIATIDDILAALRKNNVDERAQDEIVAILHSLKDQVVGV